MNIDTGKLKRNVVDAAIMSVTVFVLYRLEWYSIIRTLYMGHNYPIEWKFEAVEFLWCVVFSIFCLIFSTGAIAATKKIKSLPTKILILSLGILLINSVWAIVFTSLINVLINGFRMVMGDVPTTAIDVYGLATASTLVQSMLMSANTMG